MNIQKLITIKTWTVVILVAAIGAVALYTSYEALYQTALQNGYIGPRAYLWPALIDAPLVVFTLALLVAQLTRQSVWLWAGLVVLYTLATVGFNLTHADQSPLGYAVAIAAPVGLLLTTEALRHLAKVHIERHTAAVSLSELHQTIAQAEVQKNALASQIEAFQRQRDSIQAELSEIKSSIDSLDAVSEDVQQAIQADALLAAGLNKAEATKLLGIHRNTFNKRLAMVNGSGLRRGGFTDS